MTRRSEFWVASGFVAVVAVLVSVFAPLIRNAVMRDVTPVSALDFDSYDCERSDLSASGWLVKADMGDGNGAIITSFLVVDDGPGEPPSGDSIIISQNFNGPDLISRPAGFGHIKIDLPKTCNRRFKILTKHQHPDDPSVLIQSCFGPFGEDVNAPHPRRCR